MKQPTNEILAKVTKPMRYTGGEWNMATAPKGACSFALTMPDVYEVGMSNLGLSILYEILRGANFRVERVYAPWQDMESELAKEKIPLYSLESKTPLKDFDLWGFSLQYEMIYTNVLNMLHLAGVPLFSRERTEDMPLVVGGGPCVYNVEPVADFFDFFVVGEGEEIILEIAAAVDVWKKEGKSGGREEILRRLAKIDGIYVPSFYEPKYDAEGKFAELAPKKSEAKKVVLKRVVKDFDAATSTSRPVLPYLSVVHDRAMLELFRGCTRGCRFCQAGMSYRPVRERTLARLKKQARELIDATGYDEMSLTSLSSADYSCLARLIDELTAEFADERLNLSLPSLRIDSFSVDIALRLQKMRKSGLTFAPEAGTQRLRDVINKGVTEQNLLDSCGAAFAKGWRAVKLYFMMGLPTETDEDVLGIAELAKKVVAEYKRVTGRGGVKVTVSVSCFVPKPHTPFQWFGQISVEEFVRRQNLLKDALRREKAVAFNWHDAALSVVEGALARGDRRLSAVIFAAWQKGAKFDGWSEYFNIENWRAAFADNNLSMDMFNERERALGEPLPWSVTSPGVSENFLRREWEKALRGELTADCRRGTCNGCGVCQSLDVAVSVGGEAVLPPPAKPAEKTALKPTDGEEKFYYRVRVQKGKEIAFLSHLDYIALFERAIRRAKLPAAYTEGFNPRLKMSFASALAVGTTSEAEYFDVALAKELSAREVFERLQKELPDGAKIYAVKKIPAHHKSLSELADTMLCRITMPFAESAATAQKSVADFNAAKEIVFTRVTPKKIREKDIKANMAAPLELIACGDGTLELRAAIKMRNEGSIKPSEVATALIEKFNLPSNVAQTQIHRVALLSGGKEL